MPHPGGLHHKSEIPDQANEASRRLIVEWTAQPWPPRVVRQAQDPGPAQHGPAGPAGSPAQPCWGPGQGLPVSRPAAAGALL